MTEHVSFTIGQDRKEKDFNLGDTLDRIIENDGDRNLLANQIDAAKSKLLTDLFQGSQQISRIELELALTDRVKLNSATYRQEKTKQAFIATCASLTALAESVLFDPSDLDHARELQKGGK